MKKTSNAYGNFIRGDQNWTPIAQAAADMLWRNGRFTQNDPCTHYNVDGTYREIWHEGTNQVNDSPACFDTGTGWRIPGQQEWGDIYKSGTISGHFQLATANTWKWYASAGKGSGFEIKPDGQTTTLFLSATGYRTNSSAALYSQGVAGYYASSSINGTTAYYASIQNASVNPAATTNRAVALPLRCIKN